MRGRRRLPWWLRTTLLVTAVMIVSAARGCIETVDPPDPTLRIENRTGETVLIYSVSVDGSETSFVLLPKVDAHSSADLSVECAHNLVARTKDGEFVSRWGPFDGCVRQDWIIEAPPAE
jgi:hypothetical protein